MSNEENREEIKTSNLNNRNQENIRGNNQRINIRGRIRQNQTNRIIRNFNQRRFNNRNRFNRNVNRVFFFRRLYLSNLPPFDSNLFLRSYLIRIFSNVGRVLRCNVHYNRFGRRFGFIMYQFPRNARFALRRFRNLRIRGYNIRISYRRPFNYGFTINNFRNRRFGFGNTRRGQRRIVFRRNVRRINNNNNLGQRRFAFRRRR
jgi:hypothetical protein